MKIADIPNLEQREIKRLLTNGLEESKDVTYLVLQKEVDFSFFPNLTKLEMSNVDLEDLDLTALTQLQELELTDCNELSNIIFPSECSLEKMAIEWCSNLSTLDISGLSQLESLTLTDCESLTDIQFGANHPLQKLTRINLNSLPWLPLTHMPNLIELNIEDEEVAGMEHFSLAESDTLQSLALSIFEFDGLLPLQSSSLKQLEFSCRPDELDLSACPELEKLILIDHDAVTELDLTALTKLKKLEIDGYDELASLSFSPEAELAFIKIKGCDELEVIYNLKTSENCQRDIRCSPILKDL